VPSSPAFSLTELLIVIGILVVLAGMTVAIVGKAYRTGRSSRVRADFNAIAIALGQYANDFKGAYPMSFDPNTGKANQFNDHVLARALIGPGPGTGPDPNLADGADGPGFRVVTNGKVYPPYLAADKFKVAVVIASDGRDQRANWELLDIFGNPIAYLPKRGKGPTLLNHVSGNADALYDMWDLVALADGEDGAWSSTDALRAKLMAQCVAAALGDGVDFNNQIGPGEALRHDGPFILISAGPDRYVVTKPDRNRPLPPVAVEVKKFAADNVYNFDR
jgi:type II secretory pathway pseudopilin PulG